MDSNEMPGGTVTYVDPAKLAHLRDRADQVQETLIKMLHDAEGSVALGEAIGSKVLAALGVRFGYEAVGAFLAFDDFREALDTVIPGTSDGVASETKQRCREAYARLGEKLAAAGGKKADQ